jgi:hypothetical protein
MDIMDWHYVTMFTSKYDPILEWMVDKTKRRTKS